MVGLSLISRAHSHVKQRPMGQDLALLIRYGVKVIWAGSSDLQFNNVINLCQALKKCYFSMGLNAPYYLLIHAGGNDIGRVPTQSLRRYICAVLKYLADTFPGTRIVWSCILPRLRWRYSDDTAAMERARTRINRAVIQSVVSRWGTSLNTQIFKINIQHCSGTTVTCHLLGMIYF